MKTCLQSVQPMADADLSLFMDRFAVERAFAATDWQSILFREFEATLLSESRGFPCVFGIAGFRANQLRFSFLDPVNAANLA